MIVSLPSVPSHILYRNCPVEELLENARAGRAPVGSNVLRLAFMPGGIVLHVTDVSSLVLCAPGLVLCALLHQVLSSACTLPGESRAQTARQAQARRHHLIVLDAGGADRRNGRSSRIIHGV